MLDVEHIIQSGGLLAIALIIFAESGLLLGFFLPGDSLLLLAGILASQGQLPLAVLLGVIFVSAVAGYEVGYEIGKRAGPRIFKRSGGVLFRKEYIDRTTRFFNKYGSAAVIAARFVPVVRTFLSVAAGVGSMSRRRYTAYNIVGAFLWGSSITLLGYALGNTVPNIDKYTIILMAVIIGLSTGGALWRLLKNKSTRQRVALELKEEWSYLFSKNKG